MDIQGLVGVLPGQPENSTLRKRKDSEKEINSRLATRGGKPENSTKMEIREKSDLLTRQGSLSI